jgi:hypothetical protein
MRTLRHAAVAALLTVAAGLAAVKIADACNHWLDRQACIQSAQSDRVTWPDSYCQTINR